jgi:hypothetical protein
MKSIATVILNRNLPEVTNKLHEHLIKYDGDEMPSSVLSLTTKQGPYTQTEILEIINTPEWTNPDVNP